MYIRAIALATILAIPHPALAKKNPRLEAPNKLPPSYCAPNVHYECLNGKPARCQNALLNGNCQKQCTGNVTGGINPCR